MKFRLSGFLIGRLVNNALVTVKCAQSTIDLVLGKKGHTSFTMGIANTQVLWDIIANPDPGLGEMYMDGKWWLEEGDIGEFVTMLARGRQKLFSGISGALFNKLLHKHPDEYDHGIAASYGQVQHHYDIGNDLYTQFLDEGMNYSCAFFENPKQSLRDAQLNKIHTTIKRLDIQKGMKVLDIGCGWGETTRIIAKETGAEAVGVTLAKTQIKMAKERSQSMTDNQPTYFLADYREHAAEHNEYYDRIVSIGMFEHVGKKNYDQYFKAVHDQLKPEGMALIHSIVKSGEPSSAKLSSSWLDKYIFPGGCIVNIEDMVNEAEQQGLTLVQQPYIQESFHYAETLRRWRAAFLNNLDKLNTEKYDTRFINMWTYYLAMCEAMFDGCGYRITQIVFKKSG